MRRQVEDAGHGPAEPDKKLHHPVRFGPGKLWAFRAGAILAVLLVAEAGLQVGFHLVPRFGVRLLSEWDERGQPVLPDPTLVWVGNRYWPEHDARGFRNPRALRRAFLVALGDSTTYGTSAPADESWPAQLTRRIGRDVYNMGTGGWGPLQSLVVLEEALARQPEHVVYGLFVGNDLYDAYSVAYEYGTLAGLCDPQLVSVFSATAHAAATAGRERHPFGNRRRWRSPPRGTPVDRGAGESPYARLRRLVSSHVMLYGLFRETVKAVGHRPAVVAADSGPVGESWLTRKTWARERLPGSVVVESGRIRTILIPRYRCLGMDTSDPRIAEGLRLAKVAIARMQQRCAERGVSFHLLLIPTKELVFAPLVAEQASTEALASLVRLETGIRDDLLAWLRTEGVNVLDALPPLRQHLQAGEALFPESKDGHPTGLGYGVIAEVVAAGLNRPAPDG